MRSGDITYDEMREMVLQSAAHSGWPKASFMQATVDQMYERILDERDPHADGPRHRQAKAW